MILSFVGACIPGHSYLPSVPTVLPASSVGVMIPSYLRFLIFRNWGSFVPLLSGLVATHATCLGEVARHSRCACTCTTNRAIQPRTVNETSRRDREYTIKRQIPEASSPSAYFQAIQGPAPRGGPRLAPPGKMATPEFAGDAFQNLPGPVHTWVHGGQTRRRRVMN